jgi:DNA polymerase III subunit delta'
MPFSSLIGNDRIKNLLKRTVLEGRIGQGLIMSGPSGVGKHEFALAFAQALNCDRPVEGDACGVCLSCRKISAAEHPDVHTISADGQFIKIDQMRELARETQFRPYEGRHRVYVIDEAERLREEAANSILKTLEEPPETSVIVLVTSKPYALLPTILSRCQMLGFAPLTSSEIETHLIRQARQSTDEVRMQARLGRGSVGRALEIDLEVYKEKRKIMMELIETMAISRDTVRLLNAAEYLGRKIERDEFEAQLDVLMVILADLFHLKLGEPAESLTNADIAGRLNRIAEAVTLEQVMKWADQFEGLQQGLAHNLNRQLAMEAVLVT